MTSGGRLCFLPRRHSTSNSPAVVCIPRRDPRGSLCCALGVLDVPQHSSATAPGGSAACQSSNSERGAELGAEGLHKGLLGRCASTRHRPSCAVQSERINSSNSSEPAREETPALLTAGCQHPQEAAGSQAGAGFAVPVLCVPCLIFPAVQQRRCLETSQLTLGFLNGETNLTSTQGKHSYLLRSLSAAAFQELLPQERLYAVWGSRGSCRRETCN